MRSLALLFIPVALAARTTQINRNREYLKYEWSYTPDKTAAWYEEHGQPLPEAAPEITVVEDKKSYVVKLDCVGCPFRVRKFAQITEEWQEPPQANSLLLNFTIDSSVPALLLNDDAIAPLASRPPATTAFQIPANTSVQTMEKMVNQHMMDRSWRVGTKYGRFELQYEHSLLATNVPGQSWVQFDVAGILMRQNHNPGSYRLSQDAQKLVQLRLRQQVTGETEELVIQSIQVIERKDREQPLKMKCGRYAMIQTEYDPLEWDYYGKFGTWARTWNRVFKGTLNWFDRNGLELIVFGLLVGAACIARWFIVRNEKKAAMAVEQDAEAAALLEPQYEAPPEYEDVPALRDFKEEEEVQKQ